MTFDLCAALGSTPGDHRFALSFADERDRILKHSLKLQRIPFVAVKLEHCIEPIGVSDRLSEPDDLVQ